MQDGQNGSPPTDTTDTPTEQTRVLLVDDHEVLAESLTLVLSQQPGITVVGVAGTLERARQMVVATAPHVVLLDHRLPDGDGVAAIRELRRLQPEAAIVVLTASAADHLLLSAVEAGASGFVSKTRGLADLTAAVRAAAAGEAVISPEMLSRLLPRLARSSRPSAPQLTDREHEVLALVAEGLSNPEIAKRLFLSTHTVRNHVANISQKLGARSKLEAMTVAIREGILPPP